MRIYSIDELFELISDAGFSEVSAFEGYIFKPALPTSKNLEILAKI